MTPKEIKKWVSENCEANPDSHIILSAKELLETFKEICKKQDQITREATLKELAKELAEAMNEDGGNKA